MAMTLVSTVTVGSGGAASIEFTNIPQTGKDLLVFMSARNDDANTVARTLAVSINGSAANDTALALWGTGSGTGTSSTTSGVLRSMQPGAATSNTFGNLSFYLCNYTSTATKSGSLDSVTENNATEAYQAINAFSDTTSSAITSLTLAYSNGNFVQHSTASLYIIS